MRVSCTGLAGVVIRMVALVSGAGGSDDGPGSEGGGDDPCVYTQSVLMFVHLP